MVINNRSFPVGCRRNQLIYALLYITLYYPPNCVRSSPLTCSICVPIPIYFIIMERSHEPILERF